MPRSYFPIKALTTAALLFFGYKIGCYTADAISDAIVFVWRVKIITREDSDSEDQDSDFEDLDTEEFPLPEKCAAPPPYETPPPYENN